MRHRITTREIKTSERRMKRWQPLHSQAADTRFLAIETRRNRGVLPPIIRGCSEPRWLREA